MSIAIIAITDKGAETASRIATKMSNSNIFIHENCIKCHKGRTFKRLKELMPHLWKNYSLLIFIMATGIVTRQIAPMVKQKDLDPAVLVLDESGNFVIPLLSGHLGGANEWGKIVANNINAIPVITTATDGRGIKAPDVYARQLNWKIMPISFLPRVNRLLLDRGYLKVWSNHEDVQNIPLTTDENYVFVDDCENADIIISAFSRKQEALYLIPRVLSIGIGCKSGTSAETIVESIKKALEMVGGTIYAVKGIFSVDIKDKEKGIIEAAHFLGVPFKTFSKKTINETNNLFNLSKSEFVRQKIGVDGVCEAASLLGIRNGKLILQKTVINKITIAISWEKYLLSESDLVIQPI